MCASTQRRVGKVQSSLVNTEAIVASAQKVDDSGLVEKPDDVSLGFVAVLEVLPVTPCHVVHEWFCRTVSLSVLHVVNLLQKCKCSSKPRASHITL